MEDKTMDDMQFAKYSADIKEVIEAIGNDTEALQNLVRNCVKYAIEENHTKINWTAVELFQDVITEELIAEIFNEV